MHKNILMAAVLLFAAVLPGRAAVRINEVYYDPEGSDGGEEWIELVSLENTVINLRDFLLDADGPNLLLPDYLLAPGEIVVLHTNIEEATHTEQGHIYLRNDAHNLGNTHGFVGLWRPNDQGQVFEFLDSYVEWGSGGHTWENQAVAAGVWYDDEFVPDVAAGYSIHWDGQGLGAAFWEADPDPVAGEAQGVTALPVEEFLLEIVENGVQLSWSSTFDGAGFQVVRRGEACRDGGEPVGWIPVSGGGGSRWYQWRDADVAGAEYQLRLLNRDGSEAFRTEYRGSEPAVPGELTLLPCYPNPFNNTAQLAFRLTGPPQPVEVALYNLLGERLQILGKFTGLAAGRHTLALEMERYPSGIYLVQVRTPGALQVQAITYLR